MFQYRHVCDESGNVLRVGLQELQISENQNSHEKGEHGRDVLGFEAKNPKCSSKVPIGNRIVIERASRQSVASTGGEKNIIRNIFKAPEISFLGSGTGEELVENVVGSFLVGQTIETGFIEPVSEDLRNGDAASVVEEELEATSVTRGIGVCDGFGVAKRSKKRTECVDAGNKRSVGPCTRAGLKSWKRPRAKEMTAAMVRRT